MEKLSLRKGKNVLTRGRIGKFKRWPRLSLGIATSMAS